MGTWSMLDEIESKTMHKDEEGDSYRKKKYDTEWSKANQNISKNLQSSLKMSPMQKKGLPSNKLEVHSYL